MRFKKAKKKKAKSTCRRTSLTSQSQRKSIRVRSHCFKVGMCCAFRDAIVIPWLQPVGSLRSCCLSMVNAEAKTSRQFPPHKCSPTGYFLFSGDHSLGSLETLAPVPLRPAPCLPPTTTLHSKSLRTSYCPVLMITSNVNRVVFTARTWLSAEWVAATGPAALIHLDEDLSL